MKDKTLLKRHIFLFSLILSVGVIRVLLDQILMLPDGCVTALIFISLYAYWTRTCQQRFSQKRVRLMITLIGVFVILFVLLRLFRVEYCLPYSASSRYVWYLYYIPITLLPALNFHAMMYVGRPDSAAPSCLWNLIYIPVILMSTGVLTNDLHHLAFRFPADMVAWDDRYTHGPLFAVVTAWVVILSVSVYFVLIRSCINRRLYRNLWLPALVAVLGLTYRLNYSFYTIYDVGERFFLQSMYELPELMGVIWIATWESAVASRLLPSNRGYMELLEVSSLRAGITDDTFTVRQRFGDTLCPTEDQFRSAADGELALEGGDTVLKARQVRGGWFYWSEDMRELRELNEALEDTADYLVEENAVLQQGAEIEEERRRTMHKTRLYDDISLRIRPRLGNLDMLLESAPAQEEEFERMLKDCAVILAFLKRFSNLLLLADEHGGASSYDLFLCLHESERALSGLGADCTLCIPDDVQLPGKTAADLYEIFELLLENELSRLKEVRVSLSPKGEKSVFVVEYGIQPSANPDGLIMAADVRACAERVGKTSVYNDRSGGHLRVEFGREEAVT
ncbi:MAG: hypothetical protein K6G90_12630 [Clostridia bacterium]|nr:hypothetical protein [Clostridia bacterium]